jgi:hypothetical protein
MLSGKLKTGKGKLLLTGKAQFHYPSPIARSVGKNMTGEINYQLSTAQ